MNLFTSSRRAALAVFMSRPRSQVALGNAVASEVALRFRCQGINESRAFVLVEGALTSSVELGVGNRLQAREEISISDEVPKDAVLNPHSNH